MNKILLSFSMLLLAAGLHAQSPVLSSSIITQIGDTIQVRSADTAGITVGADGAMQSWKITLDTSNSQMSEDYAVDPAKTPFAADFPTANLAAGSASGAYTYFKTSSTQVELIGYAVEQGGQKMVQTYTDPQIHLKVPFAYQDKFTDNVAANYEANGVMIYRTGTNMVEAVGYGTLEVNGVTFKNVLKVKSVNLLKDSMNINGTVLEFNTNSETYSFVTNYKKQAILSIMETVMKQNGQENVSKSVLYDLSAPAQSGISKAGAQNIALEVYPNPSQGPVNLLFTPEKAGRATINIMDMQGRVIITENLNISQAGPQQHTIATAQLDKGIYIMQFLLNDQLSVQRIIVE